MVAENATHEHERRAGLCAAHRGYAEPPRPRNAQGELRTVGVELEIGGIDLGRTAQVVQAVLGGTVEIDGPARGAVHGTRWGTFKVELDARALVERKYLKPLEWLGVEDGSETARTVEESVVAVASELVPMEVTSPPLPWDELHELDPLWAALRDAGAEDTHAALLHAFGLHLNPEAPDLEVETIRDHVRAFLLLAPWLTLACHVDFARKVAPYIKPFPDAYAQLVLADDYAPDWDGFVADYVEHNPTRNRPLDMVPLLVAATGKDLSQRVKEWQLVKPRPTFHYRLPNSEIGREAYSLASDWNRWIAVEQLAAAPDRLAELARMYVASAPTESAWAHEVAERLGLAAPEEAERA